MNFHDSRSNAITNFFYFKLFGKPRNINDPAVFHKISLIAFFAWVGLGADGLSSSAYGPEEAFRTLGTHSYLAIFLAMATAFTVFIISYAYSRIIEHFPNGGGGYVVATHLLGKKAGVISGCALIVDYILTITVSIVSCTDGMFSYLPIEWQHFKIGFSALLITVLIVLNIRGVKESIAVLAPIFVLFLVTHLVLLSYGLFSHVDKVFPVIHQTRSGLLYDVKGIGILGIALILIRAFSLGGGTYTGIEAVSNGVQMMRDPKVRTGKRTMFYMALSLAITAGGLLICYLLVDIRPVAGRTLNSVLADTLFNPWKLGKPLAFITIFSESALLLVAAQAGFIDAPRVMANMAIDSWLPHRFSAFSERLTMRNGIIIIGIAALMVLFYTHGSLGALVVMYAINVFITFSLSELGMLLSYLKNRKNQAQWKRRVLLFSIGFLLCMTILLFTIFEKFSEGGWLTLVITVSLIALCYTIYRHYRKIQAGMRKLDEMLAGITVPSPISNKTIDKNEMTAIQLVSSFNGFGVHTFLSIIRSFQGLYKNIVFVSVAVIDQGIFKGKENLHGLQESTVKSLQKYVDLAQRFGFCAEYRMTIGTDVVESATSICSETQKDFPRSTVFSGQLVFHNEKFYHRLLHNETAYAIQRRLQWSGITNVILPIRMQS
jgi:amino acid transporter